MGDRPDLSVLKDFAAGASELCEQARAGAIDPRTPFRDAVLLAQDALEQVEVAGAHVGLELLAASSLTGRRVLGALLDERPEVEDAARSLIDEVLSAIAEAASRAGAGDLDACLPEDLERALTEIASTAGAADSHDAGEPAGFEAEVGAAAVEEFKEHGPTEGSDAEGSALVEPQFEEPVPEPEPDVTAAVSNNEVVSTQEPAMNAEWVIDGPATELEDVDRSAAAGEDELDANPLSAEMAPSSGDAADAVGENCVPELSGHISPPTFPDSEAVHQAEECAERVLSSDTPVKDAGDPSLVPEAESGQAFETSTPIEQSSASDESSQALVDPVEPTAIDPLAPTAIDPAALDEPSMEFGGELTPEQMAALMSEGGDDVEPKWGSFPIQLEASKLELLVFTVADVKSMLEQFGAIVGQLSDFGTREEGCRALNDLSQGLGRICEFFSFVSLRTIVEILGEVAGGASAMPEELMPELLVRVAALQNLIEQHIRGLECGMELRWPLDTLAERTRTLLSGRPLDPAITGWHAGDAQRALELDLVVEGLEAPPKPGDAPFQAPAGAAGATSSEAGPVAGAILAAAKPASDTVQMLRVPAAIMDEMLDMMSQMVLAKNRVANLVRAVQDESGGGESIEALSAVSDELAQLTGGMQTLMMRARMQPIQKLFERYPRVVRDAGSLLDREVVLDMAGEQTLVDKTVFDGLAEPLGQLLRYIVSKQIESPSEREQAGKPRAATIRLSASNQGSKVVVSLEHDGIVPDPGEIARRALEAGLSSAELLDAMSESALQALIFEPLYGEEQLSRAAAAIQDLNGAIDVRAETGRGARIDISTPVTMAIIPAILVAVEEAIFAIPFQSVLEIVRLSDVEVSSVNRRPVLRLRERVLPIVDPVEAFAGRTSSLESKFGVVVSVGDSCAAVVADRIVGHQDIVIKGLDDRYTSSRFFSGATIRDDGAISLIFDVAHLVAHGCAESAAHRDRVHREIAPEAGGSPHVVREVQVV